LPNFFNYLSFYKNFVREISLKLQEISTWNFVGRWISMGICAVHKNLNSALPNFVVNALCSFLHFEVVREITRKTIRDFNKKLCRLIDRIDKKCSAKNSYSALPNFGIIALWTFSRDITLKLQEVYFPVSKTYSGSITQLKPGSCNLEPIFSEAFLL
jgi:hypothetical protein